MGKRFKEKLQYEFDNLMSKGTIALVGILFLATTAVIVLAGIIGFLFGDGAISDNIWASIMHTIDAGTITGTDTSDISFLVLMSIVTLCGLFVTSILIGIITTGFEEKLQSLKKGNSKVIEKNHTLILGFNESIFTIISELIIANENQKNGCIVVLSPEDKETMETAIAEQITDFKTTRVICRTGNITDFNSLEQCAIDYCSSVIINETIDFLTVKAVLAVNSYFKASKKKTNAHIVATVNSAENYQAALIAGEGNVELVLVHDAISRIIAQTCRQPGLSNVLIELFDYDGNELYFENFPELSGFDFKDTLNLFRKATVFGYKREGKIYLNPPKDTKLTKEDMLLLLVEDDGVAKPQLSDITISTKDYISTASVKDEPENILILGINDKLYKILKELNNYFTKGSKITIAHDDEYDLSELKSLKNIEVIFNKCDTNERAQLNELTKGDLHHVLLLSKDDDDSETSDAMTLLKLIHLRDIAQKENKTFNITSEMKNSVNQKLARVANVNDLVIGSDIVNLIVTQISQSRDLSIVFADLLNVEGSEIYIRSAQNYVILNKPVDFYTITEIAIQRGEIAIGYKKQLGHTFEIVTSPDKAEKITFTKDDYIIVLAED